MKMYIKSIAKGTSVYIFGMILNRAIGLILLPVYTHYLLPKDYGILGYIDTLTLFSSTIILLGLDGTILRFYFDYENDDKKLRDFLSTIYLFVIVVACIAMAIIEIVGNLSPSIFSNSISYIPYIRLGMLSSILSFIPALSLNYYRAQNKPIKYVLMSTISFLLTSIFIIYFVAFKQRGALGSLEGSLIAGTIIFTLYFLDIRKKISYIISKDILRKALKYGMPLVPGAIGAWIMSSAGKMLIAKYSTLDNLGLYNLGFTFSAVIFLIISGFNNTWYSFFFATIKKDKGVAVIAKIITIYVAVFLYIGLILNSFSYDVIHIMTNNKFWGAYQVVPFILLANLFQGLYYIPSTVILYEKKTQYQSMIAVLVSIISLGLNFILSARYGMYGTAACMIFSFLLLLILNYLYSRRLLSIPYEYNKILKVFLIFGVMYTIISCANIMEIKYLLAWKLILLIIFPIILYFSSILTLGDESGGVLHV